MLSEIKSNKKRKEKKRKEILPEMRQFFPKTREL
jgi:hypothetical protein